MEELRILDEEEWLNGLEVGHTRFNAGRSPSSWSAKDNEVYPTPRRQPAPHMMYHAHSRMERSLRRSSPNAYACCECPLTFRKVSSLRGHMERRHQATESRKCTNCNRSYSTHIVVEPDEPDEVVEQRSSTAQNYICGGSIDGLHGYTLWGCTQLFLLESDLYEHFQSQEGQACIAPLWSEMEVTPRPTNVTQPPSFSTLTWASNIQEPDTESSRMAVWPTWLTLLYPNLRYWTLDRIRNDEQSLSGQDLSYRHRTVNTGQQSNVQVDNTTASAGDHSIESLIEYQQNNGEASLPLLSYHFENRIQSWEIRDHEEGHTVHPRRSETPNIYSTLYTQEAGTGAHLNHEILQQPGSESTPADESTVIERNSSPENTVVQQPPSLQIAAESQKLSPISLHDVENYNSNSESELSFVGAVRSDTTSVQIDELDLEHWRIVHEVAQNVLSEYYRRYGRSRTRTCPSEQCGNVNTTVKTTTRRAGDTANSKAKKRAHREEDYNQSEDDQDEDKSVPTPKRTKDIDGDTMRLFACPYAKFDSHRYSEHNQTEKKYRKCSSNYLKDVNRVKQHLYRTHKRPDWYCGNCYQDFESREELNVHSKRRPPCDEQATKFEETMTDTQYTQIKRRSQEKSDRESWYKVYETLFPGAPRPLSPYVSMSDPASVQHFITFFQWFGPQRFLSLVQTRREENGNSLQLEASTQAVIDEALEVALHNYLEQLGSSSELEEQLEDTPAQVNGRDIGNVEPLIPPYRALEQDRLHTNQAFHPSDISIGPEAGNPNSAPTAHPQTTDHRHQSDNPTTQQLYEEVADLPEPHFQYFDLHGPQLEQGFGIYDMLDDFSAYSLPGTGTNYQTTHIPSLS